jgi:hypothetical protein
MSQSQINYLQREIAELHKAEAREVQKEADLLSKINRATEAASRTKSASTIESKRKEIERASKDLADAKKKRADISSRIAEKSSPTSRVWPCPALERARKCWVFVPSFILWC